MTISRGFDPSGANTYTDSTTGQSTADSGAYDAQQALTPDNLTAAYQQVYGSAPTADWLKQTQETYNGGDVTKVLQDLGYSKATSSAADALGIPNTMGSDSTMASGAAALQNMGATPDPKSPSYQGVPTTWVLNGQKFIYGNTNNGRDASSAAWMDASALPEGVSAMNATEQTPQDWSNAKLFGLGALGLAGAAALAPALGGTAAGAEAFPVTGGSLIPGTELGALGAGAGAATGAGLSAAEIANGLKLGSGALGLINGLSSLGKSGTSSGTNGTSASNLVPSGGTSAGGALPGNLSPTALAGGQVNNTDPFANEDKYQQIGYNLAMAPENTVHAASGGSVTDLAQLQDVHPKLFQMLAGKPKSSFFTYGSESNGLPTQFMGGQMGKPSPNIPVSGQQPSAPTSGSATQQALALINGAPLSGYAHGGDVHVPEFITGATGHYVKGKGTGQSDEIPAMLADGEFVFDADTVAQLGDGSSDAGAHLLDEFRKSLREHKRAAPTDKIPPKASPLQYMKQALHRAGRK
jgi:hypothetical protein